MKLTEWGGKNCFGFKAVEVTPTETKVKIQGRNALGKSNIAALVAAVVDPRGIDGDPITYGENVAAAHFTCTLPDGTQVRAERGWRITKSGKRTTEIVVQEIDGKKVTEFKDASEPLASMLGPFQRVDRILDIKTPSECRALGDSILAGSGLDVSAMDAAISASETEATTARAALKTARARLLGCPQAPAGTPDAEVSVAEKAAEAMRLRESRAEYEAGLRALDAMRQRHTVANATLVDAENALAAAQRVVDEAKESLAAIVAEGVTMKAQVEALAATAPTPEAIEAAEAAMGTIEATNAQVRTAIAHRAAADEASKAERALADAEAAVVTAREAKTDALKVCPMPTPAMSIDEDGLVQYEGVRLHELSDGQRLVVGVAVGLETIGDIGALFIDRGESIDEENEARCLAMCEAKGVLLVMAETVKGMPSLTITGAESMTE
jgi:hypothetical protein